MNRTPLSYDTFQSLESQATPPLVASPEFLIRHISCSLINIRTIISSLEHPSIVGTAKRGNNDGDVYIMLPREALSETVSKFLVILRKFEKSVLNPILFLHNLCDVRQNHTVRSLTWSRSIKLYSKRIVLRNSQVPKVLCRLSRNLNRVRSELESLVYWTDNILLASLADSAREELSYRKSRTMSHAPSAEQFGILIDDCIDVTHTGWSIINQISQAETILATPINLGPIGKSRSSFSCGEGFGKSLNSRRKPSSSFDRRFRHRSIGLYQPKAGVDLNRVMTRLSIILDPERTLRTIHVAEQFLRMID